MFERGLNHQYMFRGHCTLLAQVWLFFLLISYNWHGGEVLGAKPMRPRPQPLVYNTTSGLFEAQVIKVDGVGFDKVHYLHRLMSVPYAEKPERFKRAVMRKYLPNVIHPPLAPVVCYQTVNLSSYGLFSLKEAAIMSEDCLVVNLYIPLPSNAQEEKELKNMSVLVHIHGGSNMVGGAALFDGSILAAHGRVIVAIINYRLSLLGFLTDTTPKYPGNYGLRDQLLAIKWIKQNCPIFNCNPESITLWGHSAGAGDVHWLAVSPLSAGVFQRAIVQSGSALSYWGYDKQPFDRYKSLKEFFECDSSLPDKATKENGAMTRLIDECLLNVPLDKLFSFKFALIDTPGPIYDGFLGEGESMINEKSPNQMLLNSKTIQGIDIMTGINGVEGFAFEGYFSTSVGIWSDLNMTSELALTMERFALLTRDKCLKRMVIDNRPLFDEYYNKKVRDFTEAETDLTGPDAKRMKTIFLNSDAIFDSGFVEFLKLVHTNQEKERARKSPESKKLGNLFAYEYLHENYGSEKNFQSLRKVLKKNYPISTHFDGIDVIFGLPIAFFHNILEAKRSHNDDYPFSSFIMDNQFGYEDMQFSKLVMTYYSNFVKNGDPNLGDPVPVKWEPYTSDKSFLKLSTSLMKKQQQNSGDSSLVGHGIRDDLYQFWFEDTNRNKYCSNDDPTASITNIYQSRSAGMQRCFELLDQSTEYAYLEEMFLLEYENCMKSAESANMSTKRLGLFNTFCLDMIVVRRMLVEYNLCCTGHSNQTETIQPYSTLCDIKEYNQTLAKYNLSMIFDYAINNLTVTFADDYSTGHATPTTNLFMSPLLLLVSTCIILGKNLFDLLLI